MFQKTTWSFERKFIFVGLCMITRRADAGSEVPADKNRHRGRRSQVLMMKSRMDYLNPVNHS